MNNFEMILLLAIVAIFVTPILLGNLIARLLKLKDTAGRISLVLFALTLGIAPFAWQFVQAKVEANQHKAALDDWNSKAKRTSNSIDPETKLSGVEITFGASDRPGAAEISSKRSSDDK
jgi:uncharacterized protein HemY